MLIDVPMPIRTPRLLIRPKELGDGAPTAAAVRETWDDLHRWMAWAERLEDNTAELQEIRTRHMMTMFLLRQELNMVGVEVVSGELAVWTGFHAINWTDRVCETGFWVRKGWQGQGLATEACNALVRFAFAALGMRRVNIAHAEGNEASRRVIEKLGFVPERVETGGSALPEKRVVDRFWYARDRVDGLPALDLCWGLAAAEIKPPAEGTSVPS